MVKKTFVIYINAFKVVAVNSPFYKEYTGHWL